MTTIQSEEKNFLERLTSIIEDNLSDEQFGVSELAREMGMSHSNLHRKVKKAAGTSISRFIRKVRLGRAQEILKESSLTISEVAFECGFHSVSYFTKCFHDHYGYPPGKVAQIEAEDTNTNLILHHNKTPGARRKQIMLIFLASAITLILALLIIVVIRPLLIQKDLTEKSIAVLPFINDSPDGSDNHYMNGTMVAILDNLKRIEDLRVTSRTTVEQYRNNPQPIPDVAKELNVRYILTGSGQKIGNIIKLNIQLIDASSDAIIWSKPYERDISEIEKLFEIQSQIAISVAAKINAAVTFEEREFIKKVHTHELTAYDFYQRGWESHLIYLNEYNNKQALKRSKVLYFRALHYDSTYAKAYLGLAFFYLHLYQNESLHTEEVFLDSALLFADLALSFDSQEADAYVVKGYHSWFSNKIDQAIMEFDMAITINPVCYYALQGKAWLYFYSFYDPIGAIENLEKSLAYERGPDLPFLLISIGQIYDFAGFKEKSQYYHKEVLRLNDDTLEYYSRIAFTEIDFGNFSKAIEMGLKGYSVDSLHPGIILSLGISYMLDGQIDSSLCYLEKFNGMYPVIENHEQLYTMHYENYRYWLSGYIEKADTLIMEEIIRQEKVIKQNIPFNPPIVAYYRLAAIWAFLGKEDLAFENLRLLSQQVHVASWIPTFLKHDPFFASIRNEPVFQQILREVEAKYQTEHEKVRKWLEENKML